MFDMFECVTTSDLQLGVLSNIYIHQYLWRNV